MTARTSFFTAILLATLCGRLFADDFAAALPDGVRAEWDLAKAFRETTPTRERICLNGLWRWQPAEAKAGGVPRERWGFFKVPGCWPGITDYMQKDSQTVFAHRSWKAAGLGALSAAFYEREFRVPASWAGRAIALDVECLNSLATVFVDGAKAGELRFPGGALDITAACKPGTTQRLSLLVIAVPLKGVMLSYTDSASARETAGRVERRGLCGDLFLASTPRGPRLGDIAVGTSFQRKEIAVAVALDSLAPDARYVLRARITKDGALVKEFASAPFASADLHEGRFTFTENWLPDKLWNTNTPKNTFALEVSLTDGARVLDTSWPQRFGFREFWIAGRDFFLNGKRISLSAVPLDNAQVSAAASTYDAARESLERLQSFGINYVYTHHYGCEPGAHLGFAEILRAADDTGMLVGFTQPHFSHYEWKAADADAANGYARHADAYVRAAGNHPSVVMYVTSHNACGYEEDMNPDMIDGVREGRDQWGANNVKLALRAEAIVRRLDSRRIVYHHASGNLGVMHNSNFYPNFVPVQELDDWFEHWSREGVKPAFTCEYGAPFTWDWTMYRGWFRGEREWGSAKVPWEFCVAEWNAQFLGDAAYRISEAEMANLRWEAKQFRNGATWHRWDYPAPVGSERFDERYPIIARYIESNWRAYRTHGVSGISPWEFEHYWKLRPGVDRSPKPLAVDWENLQRPGFSADYLGERYARMDLAFERADWIATPAAQALLRNNRPLLACIAGKDGAVTSKDHNFTAGETVEKQIVVINNSREETRCELRWWLDLPQPLAGEKSVNVAAGGQVRIPVLLSLPATLAAGRHELRLSAKFNRETQEDRFAVHILPSAAPATHSDAKRALFDPAGETATLLQSIGVTARLVSADADLAPFDTLIIGKGALTLDGAMPDVRRVRDGLKLIVFEQTAEVLEKRLGFRVQQYGLREVFVRVPDHPLLAGLAPDHLRDWRGAATTLPPRLKYELRPRYGPTVEWAGIKVTRAWRCGNRGNVASALIEKPARGDWMPILDGGYALQYAPLLEYREGRGLVIFCQADVTARTEVDPAAALLVRNLVRYMADWKPSPRRDAIFAGDDAASAFLDSIGITARKFDGTLAKDEALILARGGGKAVGKEAIAAFQKSGGRVIGIGLDVDDAMAITPTVTVKNAEHVSSFFEAPGASSPFAGICAANVHNRDPCPLPLVTAGMKTLGDGVLAQSADGSAVLDQMAPWEFRSPQQNVRRTFRQSSIALARLLANAGIASATPLLDRIRQPLDPAKPERRWLEGLYLDQPEEWDDPYRFFRW
jgi:hypothetical protein